MHCYSYLQLSRVTRRIGVVVKYTQIRVKTNSKLNNLCRYSRIKEYTFHLVYILMFFIIYKLSEGNETHAFFNEKIRIIKNVISTKDHKENE